MVVWAYFLAMSDPFFGLSSRTMFRQVSLGMPGRDVGPACRTEEFDFKNGVTIGRVAYPGMKLFSTRYPIQLRDFDVNLRLVRRGPLGIDVPLPFQQVAWDANTSSESAQGVFVSSSSEVTGGVTRSDALGRVRVELRALPIPTGKDFGWILMTFRHMVGGQEVSRAGLASGSQLAYASYSHNYVGRFCDY